MSEARDLLQDNPGPDEVAQLLRATHTIAVVGLSDKPHRDSHRVAAYMQRRGYRIIPVNPAVSEVLGEKAYAQLEDVPEKIDLVNVFRRADAVPEVVDSAIAVGAGAVWLQLGIVHDDAASKARAAGLRVVQDQCLMVEHRRLL
jgi:predicted CoA-binding protein